MIGKQIIVLCIILLHVNVRNVEALSIDGKQKIVSFLIFHVTECNKDHAIGKEDLTNVLKTGSINSLNPCFIACMLKRIGIFDKKGLLNETKAIELSKEFLSSGEQRKFPDMLKNCSSVNTIEVSDGKNGCERVKLITECAPDLFSWFYKSN